jgi:hypothetical protein
MVPDSASAHAPIQLPKDNVCHAKEAKTARVWSRLHRRASLAAPMPRGPRQEWAKTYANCSRFCILPRLARHFAASSWQGGALGKPSHMQM